MSEAKSGDSIEISRAETEKGGSMLPPVTRLDVDIFMDALKGGKQKDKVGWLKDAAKFIVGTKGLDLRRKAKFKFQDDGTLSVCITLGHPIMIMRSCASYDRGKVEALHKWLGEMLSGKEDREFDLSNFP